MNGSVRVKTADLELPQPQQQQPAHPPTNPTTNAQQHSNTNNTDDTGRAVDNQYSFV